MNYSYSFSLAYLKEKIREIAMASMVKPVFFAQHNEESLDITIVNNSKAFYNDGVRATAEMIILALEKEANGNDTV